MPPLVLIAAPPVQGPGLYHVRLMGPSSRVAEWEAAVQTFFKSLRVE